MKRLLTYLGLLATLLAMPYYAKADNWDYYLHGSFDDWANDPSYFFGGTSSSGGDISWGKTISGSTLLTNADGTTVRFKVWIKYTGDNSSNYNLGATNGDNTVITLGTPCEISSSNGGNAIQINNVQANHNYRFEFVSYGGRNSGKITVTDEGKIEEKIELLTDAYKDGVNWIGISYNEYNSTTGTYTWYLSSINGFTNNSSLFKLKINDTWFGGGGSNIATIGTEWSTLTSPGQDCKASYSAPSSGKAIRLEVTKDGNNWKAHIVEGDGPHDYYWVSPQITNGEMWPAFKMVASRNRYWSGKKVIGDGLISTKYYTFTIKDDDLVRWRTKNKIENGQPIQWYILRDDGQVAYRPTTDYAAGYKPHDNNPYDTNHPISGNTDDDGYVSYINFWNGSSYDGADAYMTTDVTNRKGSWAFNKGTAKAHTFNLNAEKGHVLYNYTNKGASTTRGYNLVGNWTTDTKASITLKEGKHMDKYCFKGGVGELIADNVEVADADSIVYKIDITKKALGIDSWGGLYLDISPSDNGTDDNDTNWGKVFRPLITTGNNLDGRALHGALTTRKDEQSLNPETSENYLGYTFSFNATKMTYRLEFHTPDATLKPGTEDGNLNFLNSTSETINVNFSNKSDGIHTTATKYSIAFGDNADITLSDDTKYTATSFKLSYDGTNIYKDDDTTTPLVTGKTVFVKIKGWDDDNNYGDVHTYQYTFYSPLTFEPKGGLFINSAKIKIQGGAKPYTWRVYKYETKKDEVSGDDVLDLHTVRSSGTFDGDYNDTDGNYRISTPGILEIEDANHNKVISDEKNLFDFTYSTSENYNAATNGADYQRVMPTDLTWRLSPTWDKTRDNGTNIGEWNYTGGKHWSGDNTVQYLHIFNNTAYQTVSNLDAGNYTVQAIVRGGAVPVYLDLNDANVASLNLTGDGDDAKTTINKFGRSEQLVEMSTDGKRGWHKLEGTVTLATAGDLKIAVRTAENGSIDLADLFLLKDANTAGNYWTKAPTSETVTEYDMSDRTVYNAFSFFERGANLNSIIKADQKTVIGMSEDNEPYLTGADKGARRHPCNVVTSNGSTWSTPMLALTDYASVIVGSENKYGDNPLVSQHAYGTTFAYTADKFSYDRATSAKMMSTMLPFPLTRSQVESMLGSGVKTYTLTDVDKTNLKVTFNVTTDNLEAHTPFFFRPLPEEAKTSMALDERVSVVATSATSSTSPSSPAQGLLGTYKHISYVGTTYTDYIPYFYQNNTFVWAANDANAKPFRVIFLLHKGGNNARMLNAIFVDDTTTGIDGITENIHQNAPVYSIDGKLVSRDGDTSRLSKGVYVKAGKKFIIK